MLQCEYCDYYKNVQVPSDKKEKKASLCEFTGFIFTRDISELNIEHPCSSVSYHAYMERKKNGPGTGANEEDNNRLAHNRYNSEHDERETRIGA